MITENNELIIFHYHLLPGGVTDVVKLGVQSIIEENRFSKITLVSARVENVEEVLSKIKKNLPKKYIDKLSYEIIPSIDYIEKREEDLDSNEIATLLKKKFGNKGSIWWIHNFHLGKNALFTNAIIENGSQGQKMILQIHDFPECSRYLNLEKLNKHTNGDNYPQSGNIRYVVINERDRRLMVESGINESTIYLLNNPVPKATLLSTSDSNKIKQAIYHRFKNDFPAAKEFGSILLYPVRTIRRKNILEAGLIANLSDKDVNLLVSLPGRSSTEKHYSDVTEECFREGLIPGYWGIGIEKEDEYVNYHNFWAASDLIISSSVQEGFGYLFLTALLQKKPLFARYLDITDGFRSIFENYPALFYKEVRIPLDKDLRDQLRKLYFNKTEEIENYIPSSIRPSLLNGIEDLLSHNYVCFSYLSLEMQKSFLERIVDNESLRRECKILNKNTISNFDKLLNSTVDSNPDDKIDIMFGNSAFNKQLFNVIDSFNNDSFSNKNSRSIQLKLLEKFCDPKYIRLIYGTGL